MNHRMFTPLPLVFCLVSCRSQAPAPAPSATVQPAQKPTEKNFANSDAGISFMVPAAWKAVAGSNSALAIQSDDGASSLTLDVPKLPFHIPGMIPIGQVTSGYVDDQKKKIADAAVTHLPDPTVPDAKQQRVKLSGHANGRATSDEAVLLVHNDKVYVLSVDGDEKGFGEAEAALDEAVKTIQWSK